MRPARLDPEFEPRLVEMAVLEALRGHAREREFHAERDAVYGVVDPVRREAAFTALHARWFAGVALDAPFHAALAEQPALSQGCARWLVAAARAAGDEAADLLVGQDTGHTGRTLLVRVRATTIAAPTALLRLLRRELLHVADMLDAAFGYDTVLPADVAGGPRAHVVRDRYRVLWNSYVDGRLLQRALVPPTVREERLAEFGRAFPRLGARTLGAFDRFFGGQQVTHAALLAFACGDES
jgi:hypothetical protein